jgi:BirA family transcriptional regulator, biotin operon repressor / biotin---[acetyl-CoA-carboxylase] ligase
VDAGTIKLTPSMQEAGFRLQVLGTVGSTNDEAMARARQGDPGGLWIAAREQTGGRGRNGRPWKTIPGNLFASLLLRSPCQPSRSPQLGFVAGVALHRAVQALTHLGRERLALKWPNDLLLDRAKLAGILVEGSSILAQDGYSEHAVVIGIGVNLAGHPADTPYRATDCAEAGFSIEPGALLPVLAEEMARGLALWSAGDGFAAIRSEWLERAGGIGETIVVRRPGREQTGRFIDLDSQGHLVLEEGGATALIQAGDIFLAPVPPLSEGMSAREQG